MPDRTLWPGAALVVGVATAAVLATGCGQDKKGLSETHPAPDPPKHLCSIVGPGLIRRAVPDATGPAYSYTSDERREKAVDPNTTSARCELYATQGRIWLTLTRYGMARNLDSPHKIENGTQRARYWFTYFCRPDDTTFASAPGDGHVGDQDCISFERTKKNTWFETLYNARWGVNQLTVRYVNHRPGVHLTDASSKESRTLVRAIARNIWTATR